MGQHDAAMKGGEGAVRMKPVRAAKFRCNLAQNHDGAWLLPKCCQVVRTWFSLDEPASCLCAEFGHRILRAKSIDQVGDMLESAHDGTVDFDHNSE